MFDWVDCHSHVGWDVNMKGVGVGVVCLMTTRTIEWENLKEREGIIPAFGVHPWFAHETDGDYLEKLKSKLQEFPNAIVGEIGLDKVAKNRETGRVYNFDIQKSVFEKQFDLAIRMNRACSVHIVKCHGSTFEWMKKLEKLPPKVMLHSFTGSVDMLRSFSKLSRCFYFGFSWIVCSRLKSLDEIIRAVPEDRLLLESDSDDAHQVRSLLETMAQRIADVKGWTLEQTVKKTHSNALHFFGQ